jgi:3-oxoacyl-[acyl-carrier-protein] synthase III
MRRAVIIGSGMALGSNEVTNQALCDMFPMLATSDEWLLKNVGVEKRYLCGEDEDLAGLFVGAALEAIEESGVKKIDRLIVGSNTQARNYPASASEVAQRLSDHIDLSSCWCLDIQNGCPGGLAAIALGADAIQSGAAETVLVVGGDVTSRMLDWFDRNTCLLLGDAASAFVMTSEDRAGDGAICLPVLSYWTQTDFGSSEIMTMESSMSPLSPFSISEQTREAAREAVRRITGQEKLPLQVSTEVEKELLEATEELKRSVKDANGASWLFPLRPHFVMDGAEVLEKIRRVVPDCGYLPALRNAGVGMDLYEQYGLLEVNKVSDISPKVRKEFLIQLAERYELFIPHQANLRGHQNLSAAFRVPMTKIYSNIAQYANTSAAATGIALYEALRKPSRYRTIRGDLSEIEAPMLEPGHKAVLVSFGSGTNVVFVVVERQK